MGKIKTYHSTTLKGNKHSKNTAKQSETNIYIYIYFIFLSILITQHMNCFVSKDFFKF